MLPDLAQLRSQYHTMRHVAPAQVGFVNMHQTPDVTASTGACTLDDPHACACVQHPFAFTSQRLVTVPIDNETRERMINSNCLWVATSLLDKNSIGLIRWDGSDLVYRGSHHSEVHRYIWLLSDDPSIRCVVSAPIEMIEKIYGTLLIQPYRMHACTQYHTATPLHKKMCQRACMVASKHMSVARMYATNYVGVTIKFKLTGALLSKMQACAISGVIENIDEFIKVYMPASRRGATMLIRECAWAVQRLIMLGMRDKESVWYWVPKDVSKLIHYAVFA